MFNIAGSVLIMLICFIVGFLAGIGIGYMYGLWGRT